MFEKETKALIDALGFEFKGGFLAGGAINSVFTNRAIHDFDLYFKSKEKFIDALNLAYDEGMWCVGLSNRAITFKGPGNGDTYQLMRMDWFETPAAIFDRFDFTCCMAAIDLDSGEMTRHDDFIMDTSRRVLRFNPRTLYPMASALRVLKYQSRGYTIEKSEMTKILATVATSGVSSWDQLADQLGGHYGESVMIDKDKPFTPENISAAIDNAIAAPHIDMPANAEAAEVALFGLSPSVITDAAKSVKNEDFDAIL